MIVRCGIVHALGGQTCNRQKGHKGLCRCKTERSQNSLTYSEWQSKDGKFLRHVGYRTIYPRNMKNAR